MSDVAMAAVQAYLKELRLPAFARLLPVVSGMMV